MLKKIDLFADLSDSAADELLRCAKQHKYPKNSIIVTEGDSHSNFYIVVSGSLKVFVDGDAGRQVVLSWLEPGDYFGELALIDGAPRSASVMTLAPTVLQIISQQDFQEFLKANPGASLSLMKAMARRIRTLTSSVRDLALLDVYGRVANLLQQRASAEKGHPALKLTHQEIADMVGASREMVSRIMRELAVGGYIEQTTGSILLLKTLPRGW
jgi:CRP/FNR family transcriptional regulator, cyclic AMP receptor protein